MSPAILVIGATGNTGKGVMENLPALLQQSRSLSHHRIIALTRSNTSPSAQKLSAVPGISLVEKNWVEIDSVWLREQEVARVFIASHNEPSQFAEEGQFYIEALNAGVKYVVRISTTAANVTADYRSYYPRTHWAIEQLLSQPEFKALQWTSLQPNVFLPFILGPAAELVKEFRKTGKQQTLALVLDASTPVGVVDPMDVGRLAAKLLIQEDTSTYNNSRLVINGPEDISGEKIRALVEEYIGEKVENFKYKDVSGIDQWADATTTGSKNLIRSIRHAPETGWAGQCTSSTTSKEVLALAPPQVGMKECFAQMLG